MSWAKLLTLLTIISTLGACQAEFKTDPINGALGDTNNGSVTDSGNNIGNGNITNGGSSNNDSSSASESTLSSFNYTNGQAQYEAQCVNCHGEDGAMGGNAKSLVGALCSTCSSMESLISKIDLTMPTSTTSNCSDQCANDVAYYIQTTFNGQEREFNDEGEIVVDNNGTPIIKGTGQDGVLDLNSGEAFYITYCQDCHGQDGQQSASLVGCNTCGDIDELTARITTTMPPQSNSQSPSDCIDDCAALVANYVLQSFNNTSASEPLPQSTHTSAQQLYRATQVLNGRIPTSGEVTLANNNQLSSVVDALLEQPEFYTILRESYNEQLYTDKFLRGRNGIAEFIRFTNRNLADAVNGDSQLEWYKQLYVEDAATEDSNFVRSATNTGIGQTGLRLIEHIVKNDLPISEILTADYSMANYYSAKGLGLENQAGLNPWPNAANPENANYPIDPEYFQPVQYITDKTDNIDHSGLLTDLTFLGRYPTTSTNVNRHRARMVMQYFLDYDILSIVSTRADLTADIDTQVPTIDNPTCNVCHDIMDPIASTFKQWYGDGDKPYLATNLNHWPSEEEILPEGFFGKAMPIERASDPISWLGEQIAADSRFYRATVKHWLAYLTGVNLIGFDQDGYQAQQQFIRDLSSDLQSNQNLKTMIKTIVLSPYFDQAINQQLLTPEQLNRKLQATMQVGWSFSNDTRDYLSKYETRYNLLYGGIDDDSVTQRTKSPSGVMAATQTRMASVVSCKNTALDFFYPAGERVLFPYVEIDDLNEQNIRANINHLIWRLHGETNNQALEDLTYNLFTQMQSTMDPLINTGVGVGVNVNGACDITNHPVTGDSLASEDQIKADSDYIIRSWQAVLAFLINDPQFLYQ